MDVQLREVTDADLPLFHEHQLDEEALRLAAFPPRDRDAFMQHWRRILADPSVLARTVLVDGVVAGNVVSFERAGRREVGYWIGRRHWGRGVATGALARFLDLVTERPLYARVAAHSAPSIRVLEKCGFGVRDDVPPLEPLDDVEEVVLVLGEPAGSPS